MQRLKRAGVDLASAEGVAILGNTDKLALMKRELEGQRQSWDELRQVGETLFNDAAAFLQPENWNNWGEAGKRIIGDIMNEFIKLAAINPLRNALFGGDSPTLSSVGGLVGKLFGGFKLPGFAGGTDSAPGGLALVGEHGPELASLPKGTSITPALTTRDLVRALGARGGGGEGMQLTFNIDVDARGATPDAAPAIEARLRQMLRGEVPAIVQDALQRRTIRV